MSDCIVCHNDSNEETIEHIVPRSLGNIHYILPKGLVCKICNQRFSKYEHAVLNSPEWLYERKKFGIVKNNISNEMTGCREVDYKRFLLKVLYESVYLSKRKYMKAYNFENIRKELNGFGTLKSTIFKNKGLSNKRSIPGWIDRWRLKRNGVQLNYYFREDKIYFEMIYGSIINVISTRIT